MKGDIGKMFADPLDDFYRRDRQQQEEIDSLPVCSCCGEHIQDEYAWLINDEWYCNECADFEFRRAVEPNA